MTQAFRRFEANAAGYAAFRPAYPQTIIDRLVRAILAEEMSPVSPVVDVGAGTGIVTRQLAQALPGDVPVIGIEPTDAMRREAIATEETPGTVSYRDGVAEALPMAAASARAIVAATAAHWFDRPRFYAESARVLLPGGALAVLDYVRDIERSPAATAMERFLRDRGGPQAYERPDYSSELRTLASFDRAEAVEQSESVSLSTESFAGLVLSSSHAQPIIAATGHDAAWAELVAIGHELADEAGTVAVGYRFRLATARRVRSIR